MSGKKGDNHKCKYVKTDKIMINGKLTTKEEWLNKQPTKQLLKYLANARACGCLYSPFETDLGFSVNELKDVLKTREHVPNKQEAKIIRQNKEKSIKRFTTDIFVCGIFFDIIQITS